MRHCRDAEAPGKLLEHLAPAAPSRPQDVGGTECGPAAQSQDEIRPAAVQDPSGWL